MSKMEMIRTGRFNGTQCIVYTDGIQIYMTRNQIVNALGYKTPNDSIRRIHERHSDRLGKYSIVLNLDVPTNDIALLASDKLTYGESILFNSEFVSDNDSLDKSSVTFKLTDTDEKYCNTYLYSRRGTMKIC